ncbi:MAG: hypothetical protein KY464_00340 [Gemmatimonadetes bacterium]|nr:hypothetical protein [Gemmatimonadota bacterium]
MMKTQYVWAPVGLALCLALAGCGGGEAEAVPGAGAPTDGAAASAPASAPAGRVIEVKMVTDGAANHFEPAEVTARKGDVIRFVLQSGVHNVSFAGDPQAAAAGLPATSPFLSSPGQVHEVPVNFAAGRYTFQCDPHVALGMVGTLTVQ